ncbi:M23 family metallopeptidase [Neolewinella persica]|uniref:M23 family metallopeptidase n=1 Tax=Neolewinella persica TaxID=70998 RepID=UPI00035CFE0A|nr:M23 family metallopeptidase [Neolewinella persica]
MFYKVLLLEIVLIGGMISLKVRQTSEAPPSSGTEVTVSSRASEDRATDLLPTEKPKPVSTIRSGELTFPVAGHDTEDVISVFGDKRGKRSHEGIDIKAPRGTYVVATTNGFVERIKEGGSGGKQLYLRDAKGRLYYYAHLDSWEVEEFEPVEAGQILGTVGDTGNAKNTTPHLHFEVLHGKDKEAIDPMEYWAPTFP